MENRNSKVDTALLCETFVNIPGYSVHETHHSTRKERGTAIFVCNEIMTKKRNDLSRFIEKELESTFLEIQAKNGRKIIVGSMYRPPNSKETKFVQEISKIASKAKCENKELILGMDHNMDWLKSSEHVMTQKFLDKSLRAGT